jgi:PPOX class probable F420-dependent enzyme
VPERTDSNRVRCFGGANTHRVYLSLRPRLLRLVGDVPTIPQDLRDLFNEPALGHVSYLNGKGQIVTFPMWVDFDGHHLLVSSPVGSRKGHAFRERPQVSVSVVSNDNRWHWVSVSGRVVDIHRDHDFAFIDRMARKYTEPTTDAGRRTPDAGRHERSS